MKYPLIARAFYGSVWCALPEHVQMIESILREHLLSGRPSDIQARIGDTAYGQEPVEEKPPSRVALVSLHGTLLNRGGMMEMSGGASPQTVERQIRAVADDPSVSEIVLSVDSPGGEALNIDEAARAVRYAASKKTVTAVANGYMASAAYWIGSQATKIIATPLSYVGSVGAVISHADVSRMLQNEGVDYRVYRTGDLKALGQPVDAHEGVLEDELNKRVTEALGLFAADVAIGRGLTAEQVLNRYALSVEGSLRGGVVMGADAVRLGLADEVGSLNDVLQSAAERTSTQTPRRRMNTQTKGKRMDPELLEELGLEASASPEQIRAAIKAREDAAQQRAEARTLAKIGSTFGMEEGANVMETLTKTHAVAADGRIYRADLTKRLEAAVIRARGNEEAGRAAATRATRLFANASIADLREEVEALEAKADDLIPPERLSQEKADKATRSTKGRY